MSNKTMYEKEKEITDKIDVKEAIKMFQNLIFVENHKIAENHCRKLAIEALEKQIPKKPLKQKFGFCDLVGFLISGLYVPNANSLLIKKNIKQGTVTTADRL